MDQTQLDSGVDIIGQAQLSQTQLCDGRYCENYCWWLDLLTDYWWTLLLVLTDNWLIVIGPSYCYYYYWLIIVVIIIVDD